SKVHLRLQYGLWLAGKRCQQREATVRGTEGGTLTAYCEYSPGWESYKKWWCRGKYWNSCRMLVKTTGSEQLVKKGRASIQDNHSRHTITMTLENLWYDDADIYWCGIERTGSDLGYKFSMVVDPGSLGKTGRKGELPHLHISICSPRSSSEGQTQLGQACPGKAASLLPVCPPPCSSS
uniref:Immunoglobulin V-set domain-containing protein n=1 Tax=Canis lupus familiaris TaxID=9615 RepID=A0A8P0SU53_CANLF